MAIYNLRGEPDLYDLDAWKVYLAELRTDDPSQYRDTLIEYAEGYIRALERDLEKTSPDAA